MTLCAAGLAANAADPYRQAALQALAARLYGLSAEEFRHVVGTFPLVPLVERRAAIEAFQDV
jgi:hypothetical protein